MQRAGKIEWRGKSDGSFSCDRCGQQIPSGNYIYSLKEGIPIYDAVCFREYILPAYIEARKREGKSVPDSQKSDEKKEE
jgi:hypothetical protein